MSNSLRNQALTTWALSKSHGNKYSKLPYSNVLTSIFPCFFCFSVWGSTLAGSSRREYVKKIEAMLPYSLLLQLRAHIPLLWVDVPPPLRVKHDSIHLRISDFILYIFFFSRGGIWSWWTANKESKKLFCVGVILFLEILVPSSE